MKLKKKSKKPGMVFGKEIEKLSTLFTSVKNMGYKDNVAFQITFALYGNQNFLLTHE